MKRRLRARRSGVTLIELLVVATIMLTLTAVSVPAIKPMMEAQLTSGAATSVSTYLNRARARAMATGRPCGVTFEFFDGSETDAATGANGVALVLRQVETPPFYCGMETTANVSGYVGADTIVLGRKCRLYTTNDPYWGIYVGGETSAKIQFDSIGPFYPIVPNSTVADGSNFEFVIEQLPGIDLPQRVAAPFKVARDPRPTMTAPIGVAQGTVVDLSSSGTDSTPFNLANNADVTVVFSPSGEVDYVVDADGKRSPTEPIYLLIGRWDRIAALGGAEDGLQNFEDATNYWVSINPNNGLTSTVPVNSPVNGIVGTNDDVIESREFARNSKRNLGAR